MLSLLSVGLATFVAFGEPAAPAAPASPSNSLSPAHYLLLNASDRRVRVTDDRLRSLMAEGLRRSSTFAALVTALTHSDVIVYIESVMALPKNTIGRLTMMPMAGEFRYLRVQIRAELSRREAIALIGHELQHALEIASETTVRDSTSLIKLYQRIGHVSGGQHSYDTEAAEDTGRVVRRELVG
jgi:hypothetical protein